MARPYKARRICSVPAIDTFGPLNQEMDSAVELTLEEYETIRLIDWLDCTQEQCADQMGVARTTVQAVYNSARKKLADCLVNGKRLEIRGGNYQLCPDGGNCCGKNCEKRGCRRRRCNNKPGGDCNEDCLSSQVVGTGGSGHEALAVFLKNLGVKVLICGGIGGGARTALAQAGIELYPGASGDADQAVEALLNGSLDYDPNTMCSHHHEGGEHNCHGHGHSCGGHN